MENYIINKISLWCGESQRGYEKDSFVQEFSYPFFDHQKHYEYFYENQISPRGESQTFIVSYISKKEYDDSVKEEFFAKLKKLRLRFHICIYKSSLVRIIILDQQVNLNSVLIYLKD